MTIKVTPTEASTPRYWWCMDMDVECGCKVCMNPTFVTHTQLQPSTCGEHGASTGLSTGYFSLRRRNNFSG